MELLEQCSRWNEDGKYQAIVDALEVIPDEERTPEMDSELARAYNNLADPDQPEGAAMLRRAVELLLRHEEYFLGDHCWNFRLGYAWFYLDQEGRALPCFREALKARPGDEDTQEFIDECLRQVSLPHFPRSFRKRTAAAWKAFARQEADLRRIMDEDKDHTRGDELVEKCESILHIAFEEISFEMGYNGQKHELILTPEGNVVRLFELVYFKKHAPGAVLEHWNILVGRQPVQGIGLRTGDGWEITGEDVQVWPEQLDERSFGLSVFCEKLLPLLNEDEGRAWWMLTTLTDQTLGEMAHIRLIDRFEALKAPKAEEPILLSQLPDRLKELGAGLSTDPELCLENYTGYTATADKDPDAGWRMDVMAGTTCCVPVLNGYLNGDDSYMDDLHSDGVAAGFLCYPLEGFTGKDRSRQIFGFRDRLEEALTDDGGPEALTLTGGATGLYCGYVDFIAWDLDAALRTAKEFFDGTDLPWAGFHVFRRDAANVWLKREQDAFEAGEAEGDAAEEVPCTPENAEAFYRQIGRWDRETEYSRCIRALDAVPEELRDCRWACAMARALENYAVLGEPGKDVLPGERKTALTVAVCLLDAVWKEGWDKAEWNKYMACAFRHLPGREEEAIPFAERWAQLDPGDKEAPTVIRQCREAAGRHGRPDSNGEPPSALARAMMDYLGCECAFFAPMENDDPIVDAYHQARKEGAREGFVPMLVKVDDILWECLVMNTWPGHGSRDDLDFDPEKAAQYRRDALAAPLSDGRAVLEEMLGQRRQEDAEDGTGRDSGAPDDGEEAEANDLFRGYWDPFSRKTSPLILAKVPVKNPWEVFAYLPFGGWNDCPDTPQLMAAAKHWFEEYGAVPAVLTHDTLEFELAAPAPAEKAMELAAQHCAFCPDVDQGGGWTVGTLADELRRSTVWYFWWD